jgi:alkaline phosphatase D
MPSEVSGQTTVLPYPLKGGPPATILSPFATARSPRVLANDPLGIDEGHGADGGEKGADGGDADRVHQGQEAQRHHGVDAPGGGGGQGHAQSTDGRRVEFRHQDIGQQAEAHGGMKTYAAMAGHEPGFFIHSGDTIYADGPIAAEKEMPNGEIWHNLAAEGVEKVAESHDEFRGCWKYNLLDEHVRAMNARVPTFFQWDDHEVVNNWSTSKDLSEDDRYTVKVVALLAARSGCAFHEMTPIRYTPAEPGRVYRKIGYGPLLDVFFIDLRSYRGPNGASMETAMTEESPILGATQLAWLKRALAGSKAVWKVIASDMPIGLVVSGNWKDQVRAEAITNGDPGPAKGCELEIADLLRFIKSAGIRNTVWLTADVHYTAAHYYNPNKA